MISYNDYINFLLYKYVSKCHTRTKHADIKYQSIKHLKEECRINLEYCPRKDMTADILTKVLLNLPNIEMI